MFLLHDLWRGRITPCERRIEKGSRYGQILHNSAELERRFCATLTPEQKRVYEEINSAELEMMGIAEEEAFTQGFQIGARMILDVLLNYPPPGKHEEKS